MYIYIYVYVYVHVYIYIQPRPLTNIALPFVTVGHACMSAFDLEEAYDAASALVAHRRIQVQF